MGKACSTKNVVRAHKAHEITPDAIGPRLGVLVYRANVPASSVAILLRVSLPTVYRWFYGINDVAVEFRKRVTRLSNMLEAALESKHLPVKGSAEVRSQALADVVRAALATTPGRGVS